MAPEKESQTPETPEQAPALELPAVLEKVTVEELAVDGICGIY